MDEMLKFPIDASVLDESEIDYELRIRGIPEKGTGRTKYLELKKIMESESNVPMTVTADDADFNLAMDALVDLQKQLKRVLTEQDEPLERTIKTKIRHYQDRAFRASATADTDVILYGAVRNIKRTLRMSAK